MQAPAQLILSNNFVNEKPVTIAYSGRVAPGPDHGDDPHREIHGDPYYGTTTNGSDPYGGTTSNGSDKYGGYFPGAPAPTDPYGGNVPD